MYFAIFFKIFSVYGESLNISYLGKKEFHSETDLNKEEEITFWIVHSFWNDGLEETF